MKSKILKYIKEYSLLTLSAFLFAVSVYTFVFPNGFTNGGVSGTVAMINYLIDTEKYAGYINLAINIPLIILAFIGLSREFAIKTTVNTVLVSAFLAIFPYIGKNGFFQYSVIEPILNESGEVIAMYADGGRSILASLYGGVVCGISLALILSINGSSGGVDIISKFIQKRNPAVSVQWGIFIINCAIIGISAFVYSYNVQTKTFNFGIESLQPIMLAIIFQYVSAKVCDVIMHGVKTALKFEVVTDHAEEISQDIISTLKHGVTVVPATGMFEKKEKQLLICIVKKNQIQEFKDVLKKYPNTFAYVAQVSEIIGEFNTRKK